MSDNDKIIVWQTDEDGRKFFTDVDYLHGSKDDRWYKAEQELGLNEELARMYAHALYEVKVELRIYQDGKSKIVKIDDREVTG